MSIQHLLLTAEGAALLGLGAGIVVGMLFPRPKIGCTVLLAVPVLMILFVSWWQGQHQESLRSTSSLDYIFGPFWPSLGAFVGYFTGVWLRSAFDKSD